MARRQALAEARAGLRFDLSLEQLEARQLLALTISEDVIRSGADISYTDAESITVAPNVILNAGGGKITLTAPSITIGQGAKLLSKGTGGAADGAITLTATNQTPFVAWSTLDAVQSWLAGAKKADVSLGRNVTVNGGAFTIDVKSGDEYSNAKTGTQTYSSMLGGFVDTIVSSANSILGLNDLLASPISVMRKQPTSTITVGESTTITSSGDVAIKGEAIADAWLYASWMLLAKATNAGGGAVGYAYTDAKATDRKSVV